MPSLARSLALARPVGGALSDRFGGIRVTLINFVLMAVFAGLLFLTLPDAGSSGSFIAFYGVFMLLFLTAGLGSGSTFQMIAVIFRKITVDRVKAAGGSDEEAQREAVTDSCRRAGFYFRYWRGGRILYPQSLWHLIGNDRLASRGDEGIPGVLYSLRGDYLAGIRA